MAIKGDLIEFAASCRARMAAGQPREDWRSGENDVIEGLDLRGADLRGIALANLTLSAVNLIGANLESARLRNVTFHECPLSGCALPQSARRKVQIIDPVGAPLWAADSAGHDYDDLDVIAAREAREAEEAALAAREARKFSEGFLASLPAWERAEYESASADEVKAAAERAQAERLRSPPPGWSDFLASMEKGRPKRQFIAAKNEELHQRTGKYATVDQLHEWAAEFDGSVPTTRSFSRDPGSSPLLQDTGPGRWVMENTGPVWAPYAGVKSYQ
jgi:hypothetical protein